MLPEPRRSGGDFLADMAAASRQRAAMLDGIELARLATLAPSPLRPRTDSFVVIAEVKRSSPSAGVLDAAVDPVAQAQAYARGGACAVSVLTEPECFGGSLDDLVAVAAALRAQGVGAMRKDFLVDPRQVLEARAAGASGVLLIAAILSDSELAELGGLALDLGMFVLGEAFDEAELVRIEAWARGCAPQQEAQDRVWIGLNCRDLRTLQVDPARFHQVPRPRGFRTIAESGIRTPQDAARVLALGWHGILVGTALMGQADPAAGVAALRASGRVGGARHVKLCGLRTAADVRAAVLAGASSVGFVVVDSPRQVTVDQLARLVALVPAGLPTVAVMRGFDAELYRRVAPHVRLVQCRAGTLPDDLSPMLAGLPDDCSPPQLVPVYRDGPGLLDTLQRDAGRVGPLVLDSAIEGSGQLGDPGRIRAAVAMARSRGLVFLAGGLTPDNVADRVADTGVQAVDVSSGVESSPCCKDAALMRRFVIAARLAHKARTPCLESAP